MFPSIPKVETTSEKINDGIGIWHSQLEKRKGSSSGTTNSTFEEVEYIKQGVEVVLVLDECKSLENLCQTLL